MELLTDNYGNPLLAFEGQVRDLQDPKTWASGFTKQTVVVETPDEKYPQELPLDATSDQTRALLRDVKVGDTVQVKASVRSSRGRNGDMIFVNLVLQDLERVRTQVQSKSQPPAPSAQDGDDYLF